MYSEIEEKVKTIRFDLKTRIFIGACFIYGTGDLEKTSPKEAVERAVEIEDLTDARVKKMKIDRPIPRARVTTTTTKRK